MKPMPAGRLLLWAILTAPGAWIVYAYLTDALSYGQVIHVSGETAVRLLIVTMAATPLRSMYPRADWALWLMRRRREFGVSTFGYALLHLVVYLLRKADPALIAIEGVQPELLTGWVAFLLFLPLALTSNDWAVRRLRRSWKRLHRLVYPAAVLTFLHWLLEAFTLESALIHAGLLASLEAIRLALSYRRQRARAPNRE